jgi:DNA-directed RNA polymerase specialized sigma24 family protein
MDGATGKPLTEAQALTACNKLLRALKRPQRVERAAQGCRLIEKIQSGAGKVSRCVQASVDVHALLRELSDVPLPREMSKPVEQPAESAWKTPERAPKPEGLEDRILWHIADLEKHARQKARQRDPKTIASETAERALQTLRNNPGAFDPEKGDLLQWLRHIQGHVIADHGRRDSKHQLHSSSDPVKLRPFELEKKQREKLLKLLTADEGSAFLAIEGDRLTYTAASERLGKPIAEVAELVRSAKATILAKTRRRPVSAGDADLLGAQDNTDLTIYLTQELNQIPGEQIDVLAARVDNATFAEAAEELGISQGTAASRFQAAQKKLRKAIEGPAEQKPLVEATEQTVDEQAPDFKRPVIEVIDEEIPDFSGHVDYDDGREPQFQNDWKRGGYHKELT